MANNMYNNNNNNNDAKRHAMRSSVVLAVVLLVALVAPPVEGVCRAAGSPDEALLLIDEEIKVLSALEAVVEGLPIVIDAGVELVVLMSVLCAKVFRLRVKGLCTVRVRGSE